ncbi:MAG TPA: EI24 domain-containing protein [Amaricoccus sp.]|nr:EI24 domain-containing protein [Amaricoccus sp.]
MSLVVDLGRALAQLGDPRFLRVLVRALILTVAALAAVFWAAVLGLGWLLPDEMSLPWIGRIGFLDDLAFWAGVGLMLALSVVLMVPAAAAVVGFFLDDVAAAVEARHYPALPPAAEMRLGDQVRDALGFFGLVIAANLVAVAIYFLVPPLAPFVFWLVNGFLLGREYFALVARRRLGPEAAAELGRRHLGRIWLAGTAMAVPLSVPVVNLVVPILGVAVFTHQYHRVAGGA